MMFPSPIPSWIFINRRVMRGPIWEQHNAIFSTTQTLFRKKSQLCVRTHFGQADGTLLGRHVASSRVDLWEFGNVVLLVLLSFTFWEVCPPENGYKEHFIRQNSSSPTATNPSPFLSWRLQQLYLQKNLTSSAAHWYPQTCSYWGTSPASASWLHGSLPQGQPSGCCRVATTYWSISMCNQ